MDKKIVIYIKMYLGGERMKELKLKKKSFNEVEAYANSCSCRCSCECYGDPYMTTYVNDYNYDNTYTRAYDHNVGVE